MCAPDVDLETAVNQECSLQRVRAREKAWTVKRVSSSATTTLVPRERVQQRVAEQIEFAPQPPEETVEAVRVAQRAKRY